MNSQKKLKLIISSFKDKDLIRFFQSFVNCFPSSNFNKNIRQISFNCFESVCEFRSKVVNGYGKNSSEAFINGLRNLIDILVEDERNQNIMRQCLRKFNLNNQSQKKLLSTQKTFKTVGDVREKVPLAMSTNFNYAKKPQKDKSIKQQIFEYFNLENLKICKPNISNKTKNHQKYMNLTSIELQQQDELQATLSKIEQLQLEINQATLENKKLKQKLASINQKKEIQSKQEVISQTNSFINNSTSKSNIYLNYASHSNTIDDSKNKVRSISVDNTLKYYAPHISNSNQSNTNEMSKKIKVPKLNLQVLPNYHGKSNKSLNQSLLEVYQKSKK